MFVDGIELWCSIGKNFIVFFFFGIYFDNVKSFFIQVQFDLSISEVIVGEWESNFKKVFDVEKVKFEYVELFGRLLSEWIMSFVFLD